MIKSSLEWIKKQLLTFGRKATLSVSKSEVKGESIIQGTVKVRKKRRTKSEMEAFRAERKKATHEKFKASAESSIDSLRSAGLSHYIWRGVCDERACSECRELEGKRFSIDKPPPIGHPGAHKCDIEGYCRCYAEPDFTGTPFDIKE